MRPKSIAWRPRPTCGTRCVRHCSCWKRYRTWQDVLAPKCNFSPKGIANAHERRRRYTLFSLFYLFDFRTDAPGRIFRECFGRLSVAWFTDVVGPAAPPQYYRWLIEHEGSWQQTWSFTVAQLLSKSEPHVEMLRQIDPKKMRSIQRKLDRELIREVMED